MKLGDMINELAVDETRVYKWSYDYSDGKLSDVGINEYGRLSRIIRLKGGTRQWDEGYFPLHTQRIRDGKFELIEGVTNADFFKKEILK